MKLRDQPDMPKHDILHKQHTNRPTASPVIISDRSDHSDHSDIIDSDDQEWPIKCILRETETEYLIDWEGPYEPTWVSRRIF